MPTRVTTVKEQWVSQSTGKANWNTKLTKEKCGYELLHKRPFKDVKIEYLLQNWDESNSLASFISEHLSSAFRPPWWKAESSNSIKLHQIHRFIPSSPHTFKFIWKNMQSLSPLAPPPYFLPGGDLRSVCVLLASGGMGHLVHENSLATLASA